MFSSQDGTRASPGVPWDKRSCTESVGTDMKNRQPRLPGDPNKIIVHEKSLISTPFIWRTTIPIGIHIPSEKETQLCRLEKICGSLRNIFSLASLDLLPFLWSDRYPQEKEPVRCGFRYNKQRSITPFHPGFTSPYIYIYIYLEPE